MKIKKMGKYMIRHQKERTARKEAFTLLLMHAGTDEDSLFGAGL